ncbi:MAG TPA: hypothetical protein VGD86_05980 [Devosia sp.]|jgi:hypothetical protein
MMRQTILTLALLAATAAPALAQGMTIAGVEGNWACRALIDGKKAGILTIFAGTYGYASVNFGSKASGTGAAEMYSDGAKFLDGTLVQGAGITKALMGFDADGKDALTLYQPQPDQTEKPILVCSPR